MSRRLRRPPRGVVDTSVVIAGAAALRGAPLHPETESGKLLLRWIEEGHFQWLYTEEILDEYKEILKRFNVRPGVIGRFINLIREEHEPPICDTRHVFLPERTDVVKMGITIAPIAFDAAQKPSGRHAETKQMANQVKEPADV